MDSADRPREIIIHQSANRPNQLMGGDRELVLVSLLTSVALAFSLASWWGLARFRRLVRRSNGGPEADGQSRSAASAGLHAAHPLPTVLSREKRACTRGAFNHQ